MYCRREGLLLAKNIFTRISLPAHRMQSNALSCVGLRLRMDRRQDRKTVLPGSANAEAGSPREALPPPPTRCRLLRAGVHIKLLVDTSAASRFDRSS
jgi:hypothetical protein